MGVLSLTLTATGFLSCGGGQNVCEEASDILAQCQNLPTGGDSQAACEGIVACISQCIVDNPQGACDQIANPNSSTPEALALTACSNNC